MRSVPGSGRENRFEYASLRLGSVSIFLRAGNESGG